MSAVLFQLGKCCYCTLFQIALNHKLFFYPLMSDSYTVNAFTSFFCICLSFTRPRRNPEGPIRPRCCRTTKTMQMFALNNSAAVRDLFCQISVQIRTKFENSSLPLMTQRLQGALPTCMSLINTAGFPKNVKQRKEKKTLTIKTKTKTLPLSPIAGQW